MKRARRSESPESSSFHPDVLPPLPVRLSQINLLDLKIRMAYVRYVQFNKQCCQDLILKKVKVETESPLRKMTSWIGRKTYSIFGYGEEEKSTRNLVSGADQRFSSVFKMLTFQPQRRQSRHLLQHASPPQGRKKMR